MPRIEATEEKQLNEMEQKMERMENQLKRSQRKIFSCFNCLVYFLILLLIGSYFLLSSISKTGIITLPYFSHKFYTAPQPTRVVEPAEVATASFVSQIRTQATVDFLAGRETSEVSLAVSEGYMTKTIQDYLNRQSKKYDQAQVAIEPENLEIFLHKNNSKIYLTALVSPVFKDDKLEIKITKLNLGRLSLPSGLANWLIKFALADSTNQLNAWLKDYGRITGIILEKGKLLINLEISKKSINLNGR